MISFLTAPTTSLCTSSEAVATSRFALSNVTACLQCGHLAIVLLRFRRSVDVAERCRSQSRDERRCLQYTRVPWLRWDGVFGAERYCAANSGIANGSRKPHDEHEPQRARRRRRFRLQVMLEGPLPSTNSMNDVPGTGL